MAQFKQTGKGYPPIDEDSLNPVPSIQLEAVLRLTATTDINASADEVEFSVSEAMREQSPLLLDLIAVSVGEPVLLESDEEQYQQFTGTVNVECILSLSDVADADQEIRSALASITEFDYKDDSGLCHRISVHTKDQAVEM